MGLTSEGLPARPTDPPGPIRPEAPSGPLPSKTASPPAKTAPVGHSDLLIDVLDLGPPPAEKEKEARAEYMAALHGGAAQFLRGGGTVGLREWSKLSQMSRAALAVEGDRLWTWRAAEIGSAAQSEEGLAQAMSEFDDGDAITQVALSKFMDGLE